MNDIIVLGWKTRIIEGLEDPLVGLEVRGPLNAAQLFYCLDPS